MGLYSPSGRLIARSSAKYRSVGFGFKRSLWNLKGTSATMFFSLQHQISRLRDFMWSFGKTSVHLVNRGPAESHESTCTTWYQKLRWTWTLIHMKSIWNHISITSHEICLNYIKFIVNFIRASYEVHMSFLRISYETKSNLFIWNLREVQMNFEWSSNELLMNFIWNEIKLFHMNLHAVRMKFIWTSYRRIDEVDMLYPCNTNEVDMRLINSSREIHMKYIWISNDLNFKWTSCELHTN